MRILMVTERMAPGGAETHIADVCRLLAARGDEVFVASAGGDLVPRLAKDGVRHETLPLDKKTPAAAIRSLRGLARLIRDGHFDVVHAHARVPAAYLGHLSRHLDFRFVTTCHGTYRMTPLRRRLAAWGDAILAVSDDVAAYLREAYDLPESRIFLTVNGVDTDRFTPAWDAGTGHRIVAVSRLTKDTSAAARALLRIFPRILDQFPDATLTLVGGGETEAELRAAAEKINRNAGRCAVTLTGARSDVLPHLQDADVFVGVSRAAIEAMSCALPVILAGDAGCAGILTDEKQPTAARTNWCCRGEKALRDNDLFRDICALLADEGLRRTIGSAGRAYVLAHASARKMADAYKALYENLPSRLFYPHADVVISGYYGYGNAGDEAMLRALLDEAHRASPDAKIAVLAAHPKKEGAAAGVRCIGRYNVFRIVPALRHARLFVSGGGTLLQDATSRRSLLYYTSLLRFARLAGAETALYASGIGPLRFASSRRAVRREATAASRISLRDGRSKDQLIDLGVPAEKCTVTADPVLLSPPVPDEAYAGCVAVAVKNLPHGSAKTLRAVADAARKVADTLGAHLVVLDLYPAEDSAVSRTLAGALSGAEIVSGDAALSAAAAAEVVIGMRLHALVSAVLAGKVAVGVSPDGKIAAFLEPLGFPALPPDATAGEIAEAAEKMLATREKWLPALRVRLAALREDAARDVSEMLQV